MTGRTLIFNKYFSYIKSCQKVQSTKFKMESELLNAVNYIENISKKKVTFAEIEAFMRKKELFTYKEDLDNNIIDSFIENGLIQVRGDGENAAFQIADEVNSSQIPPSPESIDDSTENTEKKPTYSRIQRKIALQWKHSSMTRVQ